MKNNLNKSLEDSRENLVDVIQKTYGPIDMLLEGGQKLQNVMLTCKCIFRSNFVLIFGGF